MIDPYRTTASVDIPDVQTIVARRLAILERITAACGRVSRDPAEIILLGATKTKSIEIVHNGIEAGIVDVGENYVQEMLDKYKALGDSARWHFIGHLQRNKVRSIVPFVHLIHGVDSEHLAGEIDKQAALLNRRIAVLMQVNVSGEASKSGIEPDGARSLAEYITRLQWVDLQGLMTIPAPSDDPEDSRPSYRMLRTLRDALGRTLGLPLTHLSMGMTHDFETAVEEGATIVRIGTALFGPR